MRGAGAERQRRKLAWRFGRLGESLCAWRLRLLGWRINPLRRMHRKIVVVDRAIAFVGGINYSADHLADFGPGAKQDYAVEIHGPLVAEIHRFTHAALAQGQRYQRSRQWWRRRRRYRERRAWWRRQRRNHNH